MQEQQGRGVQWWVLGSAALMVVGAFGPWVKALGVSVGGTDGSNDGWLVVAAAAIGGLLFWSLRARRGGGIWALLGGIAGAGVSIYDRSHVQSAINHGGVFASALVRVGWGLNLDLVASISMAVAAAVYIYQTQSLAQLPILGPFPILPPPELPDEEPPSGPPTSAPPPTPPPASSGPPWSPAE